MTAGAGRHLRRAALLALLWGVALAGLLGATALTLPRLGDPSTPRAVELVAFTPLGTVLALLSVIAGVVLVAAHHGIHRVVASGSTSLAMFLLAVHLAWLAPLYLGSAPTAAPGPPLVVLAQNFEYGDAHDLAKDALAAQADILVVTDVVPGQLTMLVGSGIPSLFPYSVGVGADGPKGSIVFSKYPLTGDIMISSGGDSRVMQVQTPQLGTIDLVALHPTPPYQDGSWRRDYSQIEQFLKLRYRSSPLPPTVVAGDLNATLDHAPLRRILHLGLTDAMDQVNAGFHPTFPAPGSHRTFGVPVPPLVQIDHVLVSHSLVVTQAETVQVHGADHLGVLAEVRAVAR